MLKVGIKGKVLSGRYMGWHIMIERDAEAHYLFLAENENPKAGFDEWFRNYEELDMRLKDVDIEWVEGH